MTDAIAVPVADKAAIENPPVPLRKAAAETLLAGAFLCAEVRRSTAAANYNAMLAEETRFRAALEALREALS
jgi:hypothetical protein